jgi:hypothetical protein
MDENPSPDALDRRLEEIARAVAALEARVAGLEEALRPREREAEPPPSQGQEALSPARKGPTGGPGASAVLSGAALACFLLVVALVLRTLADSGILGPRVGVGMGFGYAAVLLLAGVFLAGVPRARAPILAATGSVLLGAVVLEAVRRLGVVDGLWGSGVLSAAAVAVGAAARRQGGSAASRVGIPALLGVALVLPLPRPPVPGLPLVVVGASVGAWLASDGGLRLLTAALSGGTFGVWAVALGTAWASAEPVAPRLAPSWFLGAVSLAALVQLVPALVGREAPRRQRWALLPGLAVFTALWASGSAWLGASPGSRQWVGLAGVAAAGALFGVSRAVGARRGPERFAGCVVAASALTALGVPALARGAPWALPILAVAALGLAHASTPWGSGAARACSYGVQAWAAGWAFFSGAFAVGGSPSLGWVAGVAAAAAAIVQYRMCRGMPLPAGSTFFGRWDRTDDLGVLPLLAGLTHLFLALRLLAWAGWAAAAVPPEAFAVAESVLLHAMALGVLVRARRAPTRELRVVGLLLLAVGGGKVFLLDLFALGGVALVGSVLSFSVAAGAGALTLRRRPGADSP